MCATSAMLCAHHLFAVWNGDRRLKEKVQNEMQCCFPLLYTVHACLCSNWRDGWSRNQSCGRLLNLVLIILPTDASSNCRHSAVTRGCYDCHVKIQISRISSIFANKSFHILSLLIRSGVRRQSCSKKAHQWFLSQRLYLENSSCQRTITKSS